ncbi:MAG: TonB-dependent receptor [Bacteroidetes bacterium]|nr:TonB-dependent receptor [Bacteroidota bacterium]
MQWIFPLSYDTGVVKIYMQAAGVEMDEVIVSSTRNYQRAELIPTRVEVIDEEEVEERSHDKPSDVSHLLREQPGVQVQRTSATNGAMNIRLQGLRGRYVQILKDGFPLFAGFSNVLGITQIPPLDLKQVEIIKGPSSTLYGGDAMAGVINLISKTPSEEPVYDLLFNGESAFAFDGGLYASQKFKWFGFSLTGAYRYQKEKDWSGWGFSETPRLKRYSFSPQLYFDLSPHARLNVGVSYTDESRLGGSMAALQGISDSLNHFLEENRSSRLSTTTRFEYDFEKQGVLTVKNSIHLFRRSVEVPGFLFSGRQLASATEINYRFHSGKHDVVLGVDFRTDKFVEEKDSTVIKNDYQYLTGGVFGQYLYHFNVKTTLEAGLRFDYNNRYRFYALPHLALLRHWNRSFSTRLNFGMGYKLPTIFQDETEAVWFKNISRIGAAVKPELSIGGTVDLKIKVPFSNGWRVSIHQLYFFTHIFRPLLGDTATSSTCLSGDCLGISYDNGKGFVETIGVETGLEVGYKGVSASVIYTLTDNHRNIQKVRSINPLTSKHIISFLAGYEVHRFYIGLDCYYYSPVKLANGGVGRGIWEVGINTQYAFKFLILFANFENILNIRQTSYGPVVFANPDYSHPRFAEIYAPLEGRLINVGFKLRLGAFWDKGKRQDQGIERLENKNEDY